MKLLSPLALFALINLFSIHLYANIEFLFDDSNNTGETTVSANFPGSVSNGSLIIDESNAPSSGSIQLSTPLSSGQYILEVVLSSHDLSGFDATAAASTATKFTPFELGLGFSLVESGASAAEVGLKSEWYVAAPFASIPVLYSNGGSSTYNSINKNGITEGNTSTASLLFNDLIMGVSPITLQINADLDAGTWTSRVKYGNGNWVDLTQDGQISSIESIEINSSASLWPWSSSSIEIDSISLSEVVAQTTKDIAINGSAWNSSVDSNLSGTAVPTTIGDTDQISSEDITMQIAADLNSGDWVSRYKLGSGEWVALVTDGQGMTDFSNIKLNVKTPSYENWGDSSITAPATGDYIKLGDIKILSASNLVKATASFDVDNSSPIFEMGFEDIAGTDLVANSETGASAISTSGKTGSFQYTGHLTDGNGNLNIGYAGSNQWVGSLFGNSFRTFNFTNPITSNDVNIAVLQVVISGYDLSKTWDSSSSGGSLDGKGIQIAVVNSNNAGAQIQLLTENELVENSFIQLEFNDNAGTTLQESLPVSAVNATGAWNFGGPQTDGEGNLNIGYAGNNAWRGLYNADNEGTIWREFTIDTDTETAGAQPITSGRYIFETSFASGDLSGSWKGADHAASNKGMQILLAKGNGSGAILNLYSFVNDSGDYQIKAVSNIWEGSASTDIPTGIGNPSSSNSGTPPYAQTFGLLGDGKVDLQIRVNVDTGQWTAFAKRTSSDVWKNLETGGEGMTDIASIRLAVKTPIKDAGSDSSSTLDDVLYDWGDDTLIGSAPESYVDANGDGQYNTGTTGALSDNVTNSPDFTLESGSYAYAATVPTSASLPQNASISISAVGNNANIVWTGNVTLEESIDLSSWTNSGAVSSPHSEALISNKYFRITAAVPEGESSANAQTFNLNVLSGSPTYYVEIVNLDGSLPPSISGTIVSGVNTIQVPASSTERTVKLVIEGPLQFSSFTHNGDNIFVGAESFTDANGNGQRDPGNASLLGDYLKLNYIRITEDTSPDSNNSIVVSGKVQGSVTGTPVLNVPIDNSSSLSGSLKIKISANLSSGNWSSEYSSDNGENWIPLVNDGEGLTSISNFTLATKTPQYDAWGDPGATGQAMMTRLLLELVEIL